MVAAQKSGQLARLIEYDPAYCDVILRRFEATKGTSAILARTGQTFSCGRVHPARNFALSGLTDGSLTSTRKLTRAWSLLGESPRPADCPMDQPASQALRDWLSVTTTINANGCPLRSS
jgi:hypothetical protein